MRASEDAPTDPDEQRPLSGKELEGLGGGMAPNQLGGAQGAPGQTGGNADKMWDVPHLDDRGYPQTSPQSGLPRTGTGPSNTPTGQGHYDLPEKRDENSEEEEPGRYEGTVEGLLEKGAPPEWSAEAAVSTNKDFKDSKWVKDPLYATRAKYLEEEAKRRNAFAKQTFNFPPYQPQQNAQPAQPPAPAPFPFNDSFTPRSRSKPLPDSELRPSREWLNKSGEPPDALHSSPFVVPSQPFIKRPR